MHDINENDHRPKRNDYKFLKGFLILLTIFMAIVFYPAFSNFYFFSKYRTFKDMVFMEAEGKFGEQIEKNFTLDKCSFFQIERPVPSVLINGRFKFDEDRTKIKWSIFQNEQKIIDGNSETIDSKLQELKPGHYNFVFESIEEGKEDNKLTVTFYHNVKFFIPCN